MNWKWFIPIWGMGQAAEDYARNYANDYMDKKMLPIIIYHLVCIVLPFSIFLGVFK